MATQISFNGAIRRLPGAYATIVSGEQNAPAALDYNTVLIIDTGLGASWGGGSGITGTLASNKDSVYTFTDIDAYRNFLKGGLQWKIAEQLFFPFQGVNGVGRVMHVKAATTVAATMTLTATGGGSNGGTFAIRVRDEGIIGNGVMTSGHLDKGYAFQIESGVIDTDKWIFKIYRGAWVGDHTDGISFNEITKANSPELLLAESPEFDNIQELIDWANTDSTFNAYFSLDSSSTVAGTGAVNDADFTSLTGYQLATGGTESYSSANLDAVLEAVRDVDYQYILSDKYGTTDYNDALVLKQIEHIKAPTTRFKKKIYVGAGQDESEFETSLTIARSYDSEQVIAVHGESKDASIITGNGLRTFPSIYTAATVVGRKLGLPVQVPITNKRININGLGHSPRFSQQERAQDAGLLLVVQDTARGGFKVLQGINTLQDNRILFNAQGVSHSIQFEDITAQIRRELVINSEIELLGDENGVNVNTLSEGRLQKWTEIYLQSRLSIPDVDNLLLDFRDVTVTRDQDNYFVTFGIVVNNEITKIFFTGFVFRT